jgi:hypothetical protein
MNTINLNSLPDMLTQFWTFVICLALNCSVYETLGVISLGGEAGQITRTSGRKNYGNNFYVS